MGKSKLYGSRDDSIKAAHSIQSHYGKKNQLRDLKIDKAQFQRKMTRI
jgi:hypothetical protein